MRIERMESTDSLSAMKSQYIEQATAPLDGMWLGGFVPMASHFGIYEGENLVGYFCVNEESYILQFYLDRSYQSQSSQIFDSIVTGVDSKAGQIKGAFVSTAEPHYLSQCLDQFSKFEVNAMMYQLDPDLCQTPEADCVLLTPVESADLSQAVDFSVESIGAPAEWLSDYYRNLINRGELYCIRKNDKLIATGESRRRDEYQKAFADIGMIVSKSERGKGLATKILRQLVEINKAIGLESICSTEKANIAAQKAIGRAGFYASNRIVQFHI